MDFPRSPQQRQGWPWQAPVDFAPGGTAMPCDWPRISVVTPSLNQGEFLEETLRSVLCQSYPNLEFLVIDGGSGDRSLEIIERYAPWLAYWESAVDRGQAHAINKGLRRCTGEIVAYLNADDYYQPDTFRRVAERFQRRREAGLVYGDCGIIDAAGGRLSTWRSRPFDPVAELCRNFIFQPTAFWRRALLEKIGFFDEGLHYVMDIDYWYRAMTVFEFDYLDRELACVRRHPRSKSSRDRAGFVAERRAVLEGFLERSVDPAINHHRRRIMAWHHFHAGEQLYHAGAREGAQAEFRLSLDLEKFDLKSCYGRLALLDCRLHTRMFPALQKLYGCSP